MGATIGAKTANHSGRGREYEGSSGAEIEARPRWHVASALRLGKTMVIKTRIGGILVDMDFAFTSDEKRDHYAAQAAITSIASAIKTAANVASVKGITEAEVEAAASKLKAPDGLEKISVVISGKYVPKTASAEAKIAEERKAAYERAIAAGLEAAVAGLVTGYTPPPAVEAELPFKTADGVEVPAETKGDE